MSFTAEELEEAMYNYYNDSGIDPFMDVWDEELNPDELPILQDIGKVEFVEATGGEGDGAGIELIIKVGERYFRKTGYYSSWDASEMDGKLVEVKAKQVTRTEYEEI